jgi:hypothetical protein
LSKNPPKIGGDSAEELPRRLVHGLEEIETMLFPTIDRSSRLASSLALGLVVLSTPSALAHGGGGGHGGGGHGSGHASTGHHSSAIGRTTGFHPGGGGGSSTRDASYVDGPLTFNPNDLPAARMHRYFEHLFHHDGNAHP